MLQAAHVEIVAGYGMTRELYDPQQCLIPPNGGEVTYTVELTQYRRSGRRLPGGACWAISPQAGRTAIEADGVPANPDNINITLAGGDAATITVRVNPNGNPGNFVFQALVQTDNLPACALNESFRADERSPKCCWWTTTAARPTGISRAITGAASRRRWRTRSLGLVGYDAGRARRRGAGAGSGGGLVHGALPERADAERGRSRRC